MGQADKIVHEYRVSKRRFDAAVSAVDLLSAEQRTELIAVLLERLESETRTPRASGPSAAPAEPVQRRRVVRAPTRGGTRRKNMKTDRAEALVRERPGLTSQEIGEVIQQARPAADSTLRQVQARRGSIERRDGRWYPVTPPNGGGPPPTAN
ncbi:MAG: hypothetical protein IPI67_13050 [Myxococcales bacterium]|nr:hypothetical protein [Myxococcales bacterium]